MIAMVRRFARRPLQSLVIVLTLGLGIGAATTMISAIHGVILAPLPYAGADRLVRVMELDDSADASATTGYETFDDWRRSLRSFSSLAANSNRSYTLTDRAEPRQLEVLGITHETFETLGVRPLHGREFVPADDVQGAPRVVVLSHELWTEAFGADETLVGRTLRMSEIDFEVIGVMPPRTRIREAEWRGARVDAWVAMRYAAGLPYACRSCRHLQVIGRLAPGVSIDAAARELETFTATLRRTHPGQYPARGFTGVKAMHEAVAGTQVKTSLWIVFGVTAVVLIAAVATAGSIRVSEMYTRRNEVQVRQALGATPGRLAAMLVGESVAHAALASLLGGGIAAAGTAWLSTDAAAFVPRAADLRVDPLVIGVCIALALLSGVAIGIIPVLRTRRWSPMGRGVIATRSRAQRLLVGVTIALSVVLLGSSAMLLRTMRNLFAAPTGLAESVAVFRLATSGTKYQDSQTLFAFYDRLLERAAALPGVQNVALTTQFPFAEDEDNASMNAQDRAGRQSAADAPDAQRFFVSPSYFATAGIPLKRGRAFTDGDRGHSEPVVILNETAARILWPQGEALGQRVRIGGGDDAPFALVVGIAGDVAPGQLGVAPRAQAYLPLAQSEGPWRVTGIARTSGGVAAIRAIVRELDPNVAFYRVTTLEALIATSEARRSFILTCLSSFSVVTLLLAILGVYGIMSLLVSSRTRELGLRMALGSTTSRIFTTVLGEGLRVVLAAVAVGTAAMLLAGRVTASLLFGVRASDPAMLALTAAIVIAASLAACSIPAWRASRLSPIDALADE